MKNLDRYKAFIDDLVKLRPCVESVWVQENAWPRLPQNEPINQLLDVLTSEQKSILSAMLQQARDGGIHDTLAYLNERITLDGLQIVVQGSELPVEPFDTELHYDWVCRTQGDEWPDNK
ncbi:DUF6547 family protein [Brevibacillus composti]|uniref:DUF6547 family protein n=1 Tax=Brevibacillus composti TaxID=2796470 RepID=UPI001E320C13|nr:DUF6547 family protein [Brevibacillus composti]